MLNAVVRQKTGHRCQSSQLNWTHSHLINIFNVDCARTRARAWHYVDIVVSFVDFATCFVLLFWLSCRRRSGSVSRLFLDFGILSEPKTPLKCLFRHTRRNVAARLQHEKLTLVKIFWELFVWASDRFCVSLCVFSYSFSHFWAHSNIMPMWWSSRAILIADDIHICIACVQYVCIFSETAKFTFKYRIIWRNVPDYAYDT